MKVCPSFQLLQLCLAVAWFTGSRGHGYLSEPPARNVREGEYTPQGLNGNNVCGSAQYLDVFDGIRETYTAGQVVEFKIVLTAHHKGHFEFSVCDRRINSSVADPDACLQHHKLLRMDPQGSYSDCQANDARGDCQPLDTLHPERWYVPPMHSSTQTHTMRFQLPPDLQCTECTLQWHWRTANSCVPAEDYGCYFDELAKAGWDAEDWCGSFCGTCGTSGGPVVLGCGEEFRNCMDIRIGHAASSTECTAVPGLGQSSGATDARCTRTCKELPDGSWPCQPGDVCVCEPMQTPTPATQAPTPATQAPTPATWVPTPTTQAPTPAPQAPTPATQAPSPAATVVTTPMPTAVSSTTAGGQERVCLHQKDCDVSPWCAQPSYETYCRTNGALNNCPTPYCYWGSAPAGGLLVQTAPCRKDDGCQTTAAASVGASLLQKTTKLDAAAALLADDSEEEGVRRQPIEERPAPWINVCYFTNWARYRSGLINIGKDVFEMGSLQAQACTHFMYGFATVKAGTYELESSDPNADHPSGHTGQDSLCPEVCNDPNFRPDWSDPGGDRCDWPCSPSRVYRGYEGLNVGMKRANPTIKGLISVGGWNFNDCAMSPSETYSQGSATCEIFSTIAASEVSIRTFARNIIDFCRRWGFDGFDLDWEYPVVAGHNSNAKVDGKFVETTQDYVNYITMLRILKEEFHSENSTHPLLLTAAVGVGKSTVETAYDIPGMSQHLDLINLMTYDLHGGWEASTGCNAPLYSTDEDRALHGYDLSVSWAVDYWLAAGAAASQLTIGLGMYGRGWTLASPANSGFNAPAIGKTAPGTATQEAGYMASYEVNEAIGAGATKVYDESRQCPYIVSGSEWVGYDDHRSICAKLQFGKSRNLAGSMIWALDLDDFAGAYSDAKYPLVNLGGQGGAGDLCGTWPIPAPSPMDSTSPMTTSPTPSPAQPSPAVPAPVSPVPDPSPVPSLPVAPTPAHPCHADTQNSVGATDPLCALTCNALPQGWWPCGEGGPCVCSWDSPTPAMPTTPPTPAPPVMPAPPAECNTCKSRCQAYCNEHSGGVQVSQCWGTPRFIQCMCKDGASHSFDGCPCEHADCPAMPASPMPTTAQPDPSTTVLATTPAAPTGQPATTPAAPPGDGLLVALLEALETSDSANVLMYNTGTEWLQSDLYTWADMISAVRSMATKGVGQVKLWIGEGQNFRYGLVNIAAFLAQCMQETIQYNACDENNWSDEATTLKSGGTAFSATSACGQVSQSYQNYLCSAEENALADGQMECDVDSNMALRATTKAGWYGAPPQLFCAPKSKVPKAPRWNHAGPWCSGDPAPFLEDVDMDEYSGYVNDGGSCRDYQGIKSGGWTYNGCSESGCPGSPAPLFDVPEGRTDVEGCCWWGRGVIQTTGVCNFGKLNFYLGKRASDEGREALFPQIDFCSKPDSICDPGSPPELKWIAGMFYWLNAVQPYEATGWSFYAELKAWVDNGMDIADASFIDGTSGIVNRGCHNPPNCGTGDLHGGSERRNNFRKVLEAMKLI